ncbi:MAG: hypothetical protein ACKPKO_63895, partial [Candidatus Fonsibacter sp.]
ENGWSLHRLAEFQRRTGRNAETAATEDRFRAAWQRADVTLRGSCYYRICLLSSDALLQQCQTSLLKCHDNVWVAELARFNHHSVNMPQPLRSLTDRYRLLLGEH